MKKGYSIFCKLALMMIITILIQSVSFAQVGDVNENIEKSKEKQEVTGTSAATYSESSGSVIVDFFVFIFANTVVAAQKAALANKHLYPERVGFNLGVDLGTGFENNTWNISSGARANWGIFATDFKFNSLSDITGKLNTVDWQVFILRIPIESLNLEYGIGFIAVPNQAVSYGSSTVGFDFKIRSIGTSFGLHYNWTQKTSLNTRFRTALEITGDYEVMRNDHFHLALLLKYNYQNYFEETDFFLLSAGVVMKLY